MREITLDEIEALAELAEHQDIMFSSKRMTESFSRRSRGKNDRNENNFNNPKENN